jgi:hypothetical protein
MEELCRKGARIWKRYFLLYSSFSLTRPRIARSTLLSKTRCWLTSFLVNTHVPLPYSRTRRIKVLQMIKYLQTHAGVNRDLKYKYSLATKFYRQKATFWPMSRIVLSFPAENQILAFVIRNGLLNRFQSGLRFTHSTTIAHKQYWWFSHSFP